MRFFYDADQKSQIKKKMDFSETIAIHGHSCRLHVGESASRNYRREAIAQQIRDIRDCILFFTASLKSPSLTPEEKVKMAAEIQRDEDSLNELEGSKSRCIIF